MSCPTQNCICCTSVHRLATTFFSPESKNYSFCKNEGGILGWIWSFEKELGFAMPSSSGFYTVCLFLSRFCLQFQSCGEGCHVNQIVSPWLSHGEPVGPVDLLLTCLSAVRGRPSAGSVTAGPSALHLPKISLLVLFLPSSLIWGVHFLFILFF